MRNDEEFERICQEELGSGNSIFTTGNPTVPWASYMEIFPLSQRKICVRWCGIDGIYRWLHPILMMWVEEPNQMSMTHFTDYASAKTAADKSPEPPTWGEYVNARYRMEDARHPLK